MLNLIEVKLAEKLGVEPTSRSRGLVIFNYTKEDIHYLIFILAGGHYYKVKICTTYEDLKEDISDVLEPSKVVDHICSFVGVK